MKFQPNPPRRYSATMTPDQLQLRADWHWEQFDRHDRAERRLVEREGRDARTQQKREATAAEYHENMAQHWEGIRDAMDEARTVYENENAPPKIPRVLR